MWRRSRLPAALSGLTVFLLSFHPARGLINPNFTPADLVRSADRIHMLEIQPPENDRLTARVLRTLKGGAPQDPALHFVTTRGQFLRPEEVEAVFHGNRPLSALLFTHEEPGWGEPEGAVLIETHWFAIRSGDDGIWEMDTDQQDVEAVWAGSARQLERAVLYTLEARAASFPVASDMRWDAILPLGQLEAPATGILRADLGPPIGSVAIVLSPGGDRLFQVLGEEELPVDLTADLGLSTASRLAAIGDFTGNGRIDIASWDGQKIFLAVQGDDGRFSTRETDISVAHCLSMDAVDFGKDRSGLLLGIADSPPLLLVPGDEGFITRTLPGGERDPGPGGVGLAVDLDGNGRWDVVQAFAGGLVIYRGGEEPGTFAAPEEVPMPLLGTPRFLLAADYDLDGRLDLLAGGLGGIALLRQEEGEPGWVNATQITGELWRHANVGEGHITGMSPADINADGRPGVTITLPEANPLVFFNRGFAVFGLAMDLVLADSNIEEAAHLNQGQSAGLMADLTGNGAQDLLTVDPEHRVWLVRGEMEENPGLWLTLALHEKMRGPRTVTVSMDGRLAGMNVLRPGQPAMIGCRRRGPVDLSWTEPDGTEKNQRIIVLHSMNAVLTP